MNTSLLGELTDEQILQEFIKRFDCEGAVLIYFQEEAEYGFGGWKNAIGRTWVNNVFKRVKQEVRLRASFQAVACGQKKWLNEKKILKI
jgi:hypothetical protein